MTPAGGSFVRERRGRALRPSTLNDENDFLPELSMDLRYAFYRRRSWILDVHSASLFGAGRPAGERTNGYWQETLGLELNFRRGRQGAMFFLDFTLDGMPEYSGRARFSYDRLLRWGVKFYN